MRLITLLRQAALEAAEESSRHPNSLEGVRLLRLSGVLSGEANGIESMQEVKV